LIKTAPLVAFAVLLAACGHAIATSSVSQSQLAPPEALKCVMDQFEKLKFQRMSYDTDRYRTSARRVNPKITFSDVQFRKTWDRLDVEIGAAAGGTDVKVTPSTVAEYFTQTGPTYDQLKTSEDADQAAQTIQRACSAAAPAPAAPAPQQ
jgi:hypothetical protein